MATLIRQPRRYPFIAWRRLKPMIQWKQGQHVFTCGGTGTGKSTVAGQFLNLRAQVVVCVSKGKDDIFAEPPYSEYVRLERWPPPRSLPGRPSPKRVLLWPVNQKTLKETRAYKKEIFSNMFDDVLLVRGNWCIDVDETHYMSDTLGLRDEITDILEQGRSAGISMWNNTQRPAGIPLAIYVNSAHAFLFQTQESYDVDRLAKLANRHTNAKEMQANLDVLESIEHHELIYLDRSGKIPPVRTIVDIRRNKHAQQRPVSSASHASRSRVAQS